ncbi:MAG TPA: long-chain fatty acid--CoA ligase [Verrucomicrobiae bacterium]|jgi:long-chain acyl-CoA synthetase|nr:long-chain fatty acid--CoA ligase [Verrucomicrobiae bacterium]
MNLAGAFSESVQKHSEKTALFWGDTKYTYSELGSRSLFVAGILRHQFNISPGDRVALWLKNCPEFIPALFGILQTGAVVVPINNFLKPDEVAYILNDAGIDTVITDGELSAHSHALKAKRPTLKLLNAENVLASFPTAPEGVRFETELLKNPTRQESDLAVLIYTSGTTGRPKGAMLSHGNLLHNVNSCRLVLHTVQEDRFAVLLPMFHSYMLTVGILLPLLVGGSIVIVKSLHPPRNLIQEIFTKRPTILPAFPQFYRSLVNAELPGKLPLRICISGSAPLPEQILREFESKFRIPLIEGYGLSEASPVVAKNPLDGTHKPGSIGLPVANVEMSVQDDNGNLLEANTVGEICVRGGNVMMGYWNQVEETAKAFRHDWLLTGDVGYRDADGYYYITDRKKDMLLVNGNNVYPREIEEVIYQFPNVKEAAVVGQSDARRGEHPVAFVVPTDGASVDENALLKFIREKLADYKVPRQVIISPALPRNATGKILKTELRKQLGAK